METQPRIGQLGQPSTAMKRRQRKALEGKLRNEHYRAITPVRARIAEVEQELSADTARIAEIEAMMADPSHYKDSRNVVAVNREYAALKEKVARLTAEWEGLVGEAERIDADYRMRREELAGGEWKA